jgi:putative transposase
MAFKLIESAQTRWRAVNAPHLVALVRAGAVFKNGKLIERPDGSRVVISKSRDTPIHRS